MTKYLLSQLILFHASGVLYFRFSVSANQQDPGARRQADRKRGRLRETLHGGNWDGDPERNN